MAVTTTDQQHAQVDNGYYILLREFLVAALLLNNHVAQPQLWDRRGAIRLDGGGKGGGNTDRDTLAGKLPQAAHGVIVRARGERTFISYGHQSKSRVILHQGQCLRFSPSLQGGKRAEFWGAATAHACAVPTVYTKKVQGHIETGRGGGRRKTNITGKK